MNINSTVAVFRAEASRVRAAAVINAHSISDIIKGIDYARRNNLGVTVIGGGHSTLCVRPDAVAIDLRTPEFQKVTKIWDIDDDDDDDGHIVHGNVRPPSCHRRRRHRHHLHVGGGATLATVGEALRGTGRSVPLGTYASVGAGLLLQGGFGYLAREHGLPIDCIEEVEMVDGTGRFRRIIANSRDYDDDSKNKNNEDGDNNGVTDDDILWALRGAGNQIGVVVTKFVLSTVEQEHIVMDRVLVERSEADMPMFLATVMRKALSLPRTANISFILSRAPHMTCHPVVFLVYTCRPPPQGKVDLLNELLVGAGVDEEAQLWRESLGSISYCDTIGKLDLPPDAINEEAFGGEAPFAAIHTCFLGGENFATNIDKVCNNLVQKIVAARNPNVRIDFQQAGGAVGDIKPYDTAFWNRGVEYSVVTCCLYNAVAVDDDAGYHQAAESDAYSWVDSVTDYVFKTAKVDIGTYSVDIMRNKKKTRSYLEDAYGDNWSRILKIRDICDPDGLFKPQGV